MNSEDISPPQASILVIDDVPLNLRLLAQFLSPLGYNVRLANNGGRALGSIHSQKPDLILLDIKMPDMDGYQVCRILKSDESTRNIPIIFVSALGETLDKVRAFNLGAVDYITKPFQFEEVAARIKSQLTIQWQKKVLQEEIKQREITEQNLQESRLLLKNILDSSLDGIAALKSIRDPIDSRIDDFCCVQANLMISQFLGKEAETLIGQPILKILLAQLNLDCFPQFVAVVEKGEMLKLDFSCQRDRLRGWYHLIAVRLGDGFSLTIRNITEQKRLELELERQARLDSLTGLANRRHFDRCLEEEWQRCARARQPLSLIICDVDFFKRYNDTYGHQAGDDCLIRVAGTLDKLVERSAGLVARYGGEEFAIVLAETSLERASRVAKSICAAVKHLKIPHCASEVGHYVTVSVGVASLAPTADDRTDRAIAAADRALYEAKAQGRDRVAVFRGLPCISARTVQ
ncbi:MAG: diguanylate cyclase [Cyanobacteriota bacterium]|nr:diguanylate cyclase [Cyanobacteriota bacterium]